MASAMTLTEDQIQSRCYIWFHNTYPQYRGLLFHVPNGGSRNMMEANKFKSMGVVAGVADIFFLWKTCCFIFEFKTLIGTQSDAQKKWQQAVEAEGFRYIIIRDEETFKSNICSIIGK